VVVAIMSLLASIAVPAVMGQYTKARVSAALINAQGFRNATGTWRLQSGSDECPSPAKLVQEKMMERGSQIQDPWGNEFSIECDEGGVTVRSAGPDRKSGTADDIIAPPETRTAQK
jgi:type II secretory pathway pseudopilin PulG